MLIDAELFKTVEETLRKNGTIEEYENNGKPLRGRMMITLGEVPENLAAEIKTDGEYFVFEMSADFLDYTAGIAVDVINRKAVSGLWITPQSDDPTIYDDWNRFFIQTLFSNLTEEGFGVPMYTFICGENSFTLVPQQD